LMSTAIEVLFGIEYGGFYFAGLDISFNNAFR